MRVLSFILLLLLSFCITGCWDRTEIENRGFVLGVAIDYASPEPKGKYDLPQVTQEKGTRKYRLTFELAKFHKLGSESADGGISRNVILTGEGEAISAVIKAMSAITYQELFFEDLQVLVISEAVAKDGIGKLLDYFIRDPGVRQRVKILVTPGRAEDILTNKLQVDEANSIYISKMVRNVNVIPRFASKQDLTDISQAFRNERSFFMSFIVVENGELRLTSVALFNKKGKYVGYLNEAETSGAKIIRTILRGGVFTAPNPANPQKLIAFELSEPKMKVNSHMEGDKLWFTLEGKFAGDLGENTEYGKDMLDEKILTEAEKAIAAELTQEVQAAYHKTQFFKTDILDLGALVHRQHPKEWEKLKDHWDEDVYPTIPLEVNLKVIIRKPGMSR